MLADEQIYRLNRWWASAGWEADDPHLRRLEESAIRLPTPQVEQIDLGRPAVHVLRGPRQVGKSTDLKLLARRALKAGIGAERIVYLSLDLLEDQPPTALVESVIRALELAGGGAPRLLLLDEVTAAGGWQTAIKALWDEGQIDRDVVVCTGSSAVDLADGTAERLPGRRGGGRDFLVLPQEFASIARVLDGTIPPSPGMTVADLVSPEGEATLAGARPHLRSLRRALELYLRFGGLPASVAEAAAGHREPSPEVQAVLWDSIVKEVQRRGASVPATQALFERVMRSLGSKVSWSRLAREMDVPLGPPRRGGRGGPDPRTLQAYVEFLATNYWALIVYFWKPDSGTGALARDKKVYFGDPLLHTITAQRVGLRRDIHADVENAVALALYRRYEPAERRAENMIAPERLHVWGTRSGGEIDFVCGPPTAIEAVEVADWESVNRQKATAPARALPGRPALVATRDELNFGRTANLIPAPLLLWALGTAGA